MLLLLTPLLVMTFMMVFFVHSIIRVATSHGCDGVDSWIRREGLRRARADALTALM